MIATAALRHNTDITNFHNRSFPFILAARRGAAPRPILGWKADVSFQRKLA